MPPPRLRNAKLVPQWSAPKADLRKELVERTKAAVDYPKTLDLSGIAQDVLPEAITIPERFPGSFFSNQSPFLNDLWCPPRQYRVRKNQRNLSAGEWARYLDAFQTLRDLGEAPFPGVVPGPVLEDFVAIHVEAMETHEGMAWGAHNMGFPHDGRNFLTWHREYLAKFEAALMAINPLVTISYWDWVNHPDIPGPLDNFTSNLYRFGVVHDPNFDPGDMPPAEMVNEALAETTYDRLNRKLEGEGPGENHNLVHNTVGGTMATFASSSDPLFWLHHAFLDKLWADWQDERGAAGNPPNVDEKLEPAPIMTRLVANVLSTRQLGYVYD